METIWPLKELNKPLWDSSYVIDKFITEGGMNSQIYLAHDINNPNKKLVAKVIYKGKDEDINAFFNSYRKEAITSLRLSKQPNLVHSYNFIYNDEKDQVALIQDYVEGIILKDYIEKKGFLTPRVALSIFRQILIGVKGLHKFDHQIIHCDLKPENIVVSHDLSKVTIIDFGIAFVINHKENSEEVLATNEGHGSEGYAAPEIYDGKMTVQYDFFSLGVILYKMIMREYPFEFAKFANENISHTDEEDRARMRRTILKPLKYDMANISINPTIPVAVENLIFRCIASKPEDLKYRYHDISEIISDVDIIINQMDNKINNARLLKPVENRNYEIKDTISVSSLTRRNKWYQQWWVLVIICIVLALLVLAAVVIFNI